MERPNWFDLKLGQAIDQANANQALADVASDPQVIAVVQAALDSRDAAAKKGGWAGPSRSQVVRNTLAEILQAQDI
jgi:hypothetical protein